MNVFEFQGWVSLAVFLAMLAVKGFALVSALTFRAPAYDAASKGNKVGWGIGLGLGFVVELVPVGSFIISLAFLVAALVYLVDVRPALSEVTRR